MDRVIKVVFFDIKDTLGYIDSPGHLVTYKPSTDRLLSTMSQSIGARIGIITNLPGSVSAETGRAMLEEAGIMQYVDPDAVIINHDAGSSKPDPAIYHYAAQKLGVEPSECLFVGENFSEILGAQVAGMQAQLKPCPPGREFKLQPIEPGSSGPADSGRLAEIAMEEEHLIGKRLVVAGLDIAGLIERTGEAPHRALSLLDYLLHEFIDRYHHAVEEQVLLPLAYAYGFPREAAQYIYEDHERGRAHFSALRAAIRKLEDGDRSVFADIKAELEAFAELYREHGRRENDETLPAIGKVLGNMEDGVIVDLMARHGPGDLGPWLALITDLETTLQQQKGKKPMTDIKTVGVLAYHRCGEQDTLVPYEILKHTSMVLNQEHNKNLSVRLLRPRRDDEELVEMQMGTRVLSDGALEDDDLFDLLFVPGGLGSGEASKDARILDTVKRHHEAGKVVATNCSGISILHRAGILNGTPVTAAATVSRRLKEEGANVLEPRTMWAGQENGTIWTSAGGSGVHGSTVAMIANYFGTEVGTYIGMGWDTYPAYGDEIFEELGPQYLSFPTHEAAIQDALEDMLLPRAS